MATFWVIFHLFIIAILALDLMVFHREAHEVKLKEALIWTAVWIILALIFNLGLYYFRGTTAALQFFTGYVIEKSLSIDNLFVFIMIFKSFDIPRRFQHKILFWGILGAIIMRAAFIFGGIALIEQFHWLLYLFGAFLIYSGIHMYLTLDKEADPTNSFIMKFCKNNLPFTDRLNNEHFFVKINNKRYMTTLFLVLIVIEASDVIFALDSIPAILAITTDQLVVYSSNIFAILGLRALYFALSDIMGLFRYLKYGIIVILIFIGTKMLIIDVWKIKIVYSLAFILSILCISVVASYLKTVIENKKTTTSKQMPNNDH